MPSKEVTDREKSAAAVVQAVETHAEAVERALQDREASFLAKGEKPPQVALLLRLEGRRLAAASDALVAADRAHEQELSDDDAPRLRRDAAARELYNACVDARDAVAAVLGDAALAPAGMAKPATIEPLALKGWAETVIARLRDPDVALPAPRRKSSKLDRAALASELDALLPLLVAALADVTREKREAEASFVAKQRAIEAYDVTFSEVATLASATFRAAGLAELASRVRPSSRRPGRIEEPAPEPSPNPE